MLLTKKSYLTLLFTTIISLCCAQHTTRFALITDTHIAHNDTQTSKHLQQITQHINSVTDVDFVITHPEGYDLDPRFVGNAKVEYDQMKALEGADFVYAKNWSCPGVTEPSKYGQILSKDMGWTIDAKHMAVTNDAYFMHCLPVRRNMIVSDEVIDAPTSLVIPEAANRVVSAQVVMKRMLESL